MSFEAADMWRRRECMWVFRTAIRQTPCFLRILDTELLR